MKRIKYLFLITILTFAFNSCADDHEDVTTNLNFITFADTSLDLIVNKNESNNIDVTIYTTKISSSDRTITIGVDIDQTTADPSAYTIPTSVTIPANTNVGKFNIDVTDIDNKLSGGGEVIVVDFETEEGLYTSDALSLYVALYCPSDLAGEYYYEDGGKPATITATGTATYTVSGDNGFGSDYPFNISDGCGTIKVTGGFLEDEFGIPVSGYGTVDYETGNITITYTVDGYFEDLVMTLIKI